MIPWWRWALTAVLVVAALLAMAAVSTLARHGLPLDADGRRAMAWAARSMALLQVTVAGMVVADAPAAVPALGVCSLWLLVLAERMAPTGPGERVRAALARVMAGRRR